jgi:hypothetical protein
MRPYWQKGVFAGFLFALALGAVYTAILIVFEIVFESRGAPHVCYEVTKTTACTYGQAIASRLMFLPVFLVVIGIPIAGIAGLLGLLIDKIKLS